METRLGMGIGQREPIDFSAGSGDVQAIALGSHHQVQHCGGAGYRRERSTGRLMTKETPPFDPAVANVRSLVDAAIAVTAAPCEANSAARTMPWLSSVTGARNQAVTSRRGFRR